MIPFQLWQTVKSVEDQEFKRCDQLIKSWAIENPTLDFRLMDDPACYSFIKKNFDEKTYNVFVSLPLGIMRADFWRYAVIYVHGGIYSDIDVYCHKEVSDLLDGKELVFLQEQPDTKLVSNFFFAATPKHPILKEVIDTMVDSFATAFEADRPMLVQDFGMHSLQLVIDKHNIELVPRDVVDQYFIHYCYGSWRESEHEYREQRFAKPITFFTTFHQKGYELYGETWIKTFIRNVAPKSPNIRAIVYAHNVNIPITHPQLTVLDFDKEIPEHAQWKEDFTARSNFTLYVYDNTIRFSHKGFVIQHALDRITDGYAIWLDGDCVMHDAPYKDFPQCILPDDTVMACQKEDAGENSCHIESGFLVFDMNNPEVDKFKQAFKLNYSVEYLLTYGEPYDGFVVYRSIVQSGIKWFDLNATYGIGGIQSDPTLTFLHPELKSRYTHNIGLTGKTQYEAWEDVRHQDRVYMQLANVGVLTPEQMHIKSLNAKKRLLNMFK